jgi:hypothetical protein
MWISLKEHFPFYWRMCPLMFVTSYGFSVTALLPTFYAKCNWLNSHFPNTWIGHGGTFIRPPSSDVNVDAEEV